MCAGVWVVVSTGAAGYMPTGVCDYKIRLMQGSLLPTVGHGGHGGMKHAGSSGCAKGRASVVSDTQIPLW
jgi:hypothetical protein